MWPVVAKGKRSMALHSSASLNRREIGPLGTLNVPLFGISACDPSSRFLARRYSNDEFI
jgi:hypothetical protein